MLLFQIQIIQVHPHFYFPPRMSESETPSYVYHYVDHGIIYGLQNTAELLEHGHGVVPEFESDFSEASRDKF